MDNKGKKSAFSSWLEDDWIKTWMSLEPELGNVDLRPYFYFSRDLLGSTSESVKRMSPTAQDLFSNLTSKSEHNRRKGIEGFKSVNESDAASIITSLCSKISQSENLDDETEPFETVLKLGKAKPTSLSEIHAFLDSLPVKVIPFSAVPLIHSIFTDSGQVGLSNSLLGKWSKDDSNKNLATICKQTLNPKK